jgi:hypothetical protein
LQVMKLLDHFHPPLKGRRTWHGFHSMWATFIASDLNTLLPRSYHAEAHVRYQIEIDCATLEDPEPVASSFTPHPASSTVVTPAKWLAPAPAQSLRFPIKTDVIEVRVFNDEGGPAIVGAIELVSPANKNRPANRDAFVSKCLALLAEGIGLAIVDIVTERAVNLHDALLGRIDDISATELDTRLYAAAYHPVRHDDEPRLDVWQNELVLGGELPTLPLFLKGGYCFPIDLAASYDRTCRGLRIDKDVAEGRAFTSAAAP